MSSTDSTVTSNFSSEPIKPQPLSNGLPPTPKVHMGACFSKVTFLQKACRGPWISSIKLFFSGAQCVIFFLIVHNSLLELALRSRFENLI
jgi:hypothetical protein